MARLKAKYNKANKKDGLRSGIPNGTDKKSRGRISKNKAGFKARKKR